MTSDQKLVLAQAININGEAQQTDMIIEECAELIHALQRYKRDPSPERLKNVCEELADVKIMIHQGEIMYSRFNEVERNVHAKIRRLETRLIAKTDKQ